MVRRTPISYLLKLTQHESSYPSESVRQQERPSNQKKLSYAPHTTFDWVPAQIIGINMFCECFQTRVVIGSIVRGAPTKLKKVN